MTMHQIFCHKINLFAQKKAFGTAVNNKIMVKAIHTLLQQMLNKHVWGVSSPVAAAMH